MGLFDNYGAEESATEQSSIEQNLNHNSDNIVESNNIFDGLFPESDNTSTEQSSNEQETNTHDNNVSSDEIKNDDISSDDVETPKIDNGTNEQSPKEPKQLNYDDLDAYFKKQKDFENTQNELAKYKEAERAAEEAKIKAEQAKANEMPDPVYKPDEYRKWVYEQNANIQREYESKLQQAENRIVAESITRSLENSYNATVEKYGNEVIGKAEQWAANIIKQHPQEAMALLKNNPSWEYIVSEYQKSDREQQYKADPEAYINAQIEARLAARQEESQVQEVNKPRRRAPSISSINTTPDPSKKVPSYLEGLF